MSQPFAEALIQAADAIGRGDVEAVLELAHPECVMETQRSVTEGAYVGHDGVRQWMADTAATFDEFVPDFTEIRDVGDRVLVIGSLRIRGKGSGIETDVPIAFVFEPRDGLIWRSKDYGDEAAAVEAAGLPPSGSG